MIAIKPSRAGEKINHLTMVGAPFSLPVPKRGERVTHVVVECVCGKRLVVHMSRLNTGLIDSCGCQSWKQRGKYAEFPSEYFSWRSMIQRCENSKSKDFARYGAVGVSVCARWHDFTLFLEDMGPKPSKSHTLDRFPDGKGNYEPGNCRWATPKEQCLNRSSTKFIEIDGKRLCLNDWARERGINIKTIARRLAKGMSEREAIFGSKRYAR